MYRRSTEHWQICVIIFQRMQLFKEPVVVDKKDVDLKLMVLMAQVYTHIFNVGITRRFLKIWPNIDMLRNLIKF